MKTHTLFALIATIALFTACTEAEIVNEQPITNKKAYTKIDDMIAKASADTVTALINNNDEADVE